MTKEPFPPHLLTRQRIGSTSVSEQPDAADEARASPAEARPSQLIRGWTDRSELGGRE
jgi:hypothetical protein